LRELPGAFVSCQYDATADEISRLEQMAGRKIFIPPSLDQKNELDRTAAMLSALDTLISAPTAVSWLGPSLGVRTFKFLYLKSWTAFGETYEPFAPAGRCIGPDDPGNWQRVFGQAAALIKPA